MFSAQDDIKLEPELEARIANWLCTEIRDTEKARMELEQEWAEIQKLYDMTELEAKKDYPFVGAATLMIPIVPMMVETMKSKIFTTIFAPKDPLNAKTRVKELKEFTKTLRKFLTWAAQSELNLRERLDTLITETLKLGTGIAKIVYTKEVRKQKLWNEELEVWEDTVYTIRDSPEIVHPPLANVLFPLETADDTLNEAAWVAEKFPVSRNQFSRWAQDRHFSKEKIELIRKWEDDSQKSEVDRERESKGEKPFDPKSVWLHEVWFDHVISDAEDGDKDLYKLVGYLHVPTQTFLRITHGWFPYALHPYEVLVHEKREHRVYGNGVGAIGSVYQKEISTQHNQRLDAMTIANANAFKRKADSMIPDDIVIRPGGSIPVDDMDDLQPLFTGQKYDSTIQEEQNSLSLLRERVGLQEYSPDVLANAQTGSLTLMLAESTRRFDQNIGRVRGFISRVMMKVMLLYQKYYPEGKPFTVLGEDGELVTTILSFPDSYIYDSVLIEVTATTSVTSAAAERQDMTSLFNLVTQSYGQIGQYLMAAENPQSPFGTKMGALVAVEGLCTYVTDLLDSYNLSNAGEITRGFAEIKVIVQLLKQQTMAQIAGGQPGMAPVPGAGGQAVPQGAGATQGQPEQGGGV